MRGNPGTWCPRTARDRHKEPELGPTRTRVFDCARRACTARRQPRQPSKQLKMYLHNPQVAHVPDCPTAAANTVARLSPDSDPSGDIHYSSSLSSPVNSSLTGDPGDPGEPICLCGPAPVLDFTQDVDVSPASVDERIGSRSLLIIHYRSQSIERWITNGRCLLHRTQCRSLHRALRCVDHGVGEA